jgi:copper chaperone CopZ
MKEKLKVNNIKCGGCENTIRTGLSKIQGLENIQADAASGEVTFDYIDHSALEAAREKLRKMGYTEDDPNMLDTAKSYVSCMIGKMK